MNPQLYFFGFADGALMFDIVQNVIEQFPADTDDDYYHDRR